MFNVAQSIYVSFLPRNYYFDFARARARANIRAGNNQHSSEMNLMGKPIPAERSNIQPGDRIACKECLTEFIATRAWSEFDSPDCRKRHHRANNALSTVQSLFLTVRDAASFAGVSQTTIRKWASDSRIRWESYDGRIRVYRPHLESLIQKRALGRKDRSTGLKNTINSVFNGGPEPQIQKSEMVN